MIRKVFAVFLFACSFFAPQMTVFAENSAVPEREKGYILTPVETAGENTITKFEMADGVMTPVYYRVDLAKTEYDDPNGDTTKYYEWAKNSERINEFK